MTQTAGVEEVPPAWTKVIQGRSEVSFLVDAQFRDLLLVDAETGQYKAIEHRARVIPIPKSRTFLHALNLGHLWIRRQLKSWQLNPPHRIHVDVFIDDPGVICTSADFVRDYD